jgi:cytochrome c oxidase subunit 2
MKKMLCRSARLSMALFAFPRNQTPLDPAGPQARHIEHTFLLIFWITSIVYAIVIAVLAMGVLRARSREAGIPAPFTPDPAVEKKATRIVAGALIATVILITIMMVSSFVTSHRTATLTDQAALRIDVYGHQWWWEVVYPNDAAPSRVIYTANEIHVPANTVVDIHGTSRDVIHSFWAPNIHGKKDLLPGYENDLTFKVDSPGVWRGQCAEYCGMQHAQMAFDIIAQSPDEFEAWYRQQLKPAADPTSPETEHGRTVFLSQACSLCHTIRGTIAGGTTAPDLTHLASRSTIAAGALKNNVANLTAWVLDAQKIKPGCRMPPNLMNSTDLNDLIAYLETLQ